MAKGEAYEIWWQTATDDEKTEAFGFGAGYMAFLHAHKTEREVCAYTLAQLEQAGYVSLDGLLEKSGGQGIALKPGDKVYRSVRGKAVLAAVIGMQPTGNGVNAIAAHIDAPRLDLKQNPFYEDTHLALAKTHYYGGIKKYQWVCMPLALRGVVFLKNGEQVDIQVGDREGDPCFVITDLLPHLAQRQMERKASEVVTGEGLNVLLGSMPDAKQKDAEQQDVKQQDAAEKSAKDAEEKAADSNDAAEGDGGGSSAKANLLRILKESYGIEEKDFVSAEIEVVPALPVRDIGFDRGLIGGYGQDDRVCAYAALQALLAIDDTPEKTVALYLSDKEEVGSQGNTGAQSAAFGLFLAELCAATAEGYSDLIARRCYAASHLLSADVAAAVDPNYKDVQDPLNANYVGKGMVIEKYTGRAGKSGGNDANPEFIAALRALFDGEKIAWQTGEIGKVDLGGGGTVAAFMANMGMQVVDCGVPVLSMHSPYEVVSKGDLYNTYRAYRAFLRGFMV